MAGLPIKTMIGIHIFSFKKVLKKCENLQKICLILLTESQFFWTFLPCTNFAPSCTWKFGMSTWSRTNLIIGFGSKGIQSLYFFPIFLTNRVWPNQSKSWKWVCVQDSPVSTNIISNVCVIYHIANFFRSSYCLCQFLASPDESHFGSNWIFLDRIVPFWIKFISTIWMQPLPIFFVHHIIFANLWQHVMNHFWTFWITFGLFHHMNLFLGFKCCHC